jgi:hypothetical protein
MTTTTKFGTLFSTVAYVAMLACGSSGPGGTSTRLGAGGAGAGVGINPGLGGSGQIGAVVPGLTADNPGGTWVIPPDSTTTTKPPKNAGGTTGAAGAAGGGAGATGTAGAAGSGAVTCAPGVVGPVVTDCGYPYASSNPLTNVTFNESEVLRAIRPSIDAKGGVVTLLYGDEHAMTMGVRQVVVTGGASNSTTDYAVSPLTASPDSVLGPRTGTNALTGDQSGLDPSLRPLWPVLYVTDVTKDASSRAGDWQMGGRPINPNAVYGTWKSAIRTVDNSTSPPTVSVTPDADPTKNDWSFIVNDPVPTGIKNEGYSAEVRWGVVFQPGHSYRLQVIVHDGDQNKVGGDSGEACIVFCAGGNTTEPPGCPVESQTCGEGMGEAGGYLPCPDGESCVNGCCTTLDCPTGVKPCGQIGAEGEIIGCQQSGETCVSGCCIFEQPIP